MGLKTGTLVLEVKKSMGFRQKSEFIFSKITASLFIYQYPPPPKKLGAKPLVLYKVLRFCFYVA